jgi:hypothetical protein
VPIVAITLGPFAKWPIWPRNPVGKSAALPLLSRREAPPIVSGLTLGLVCWSLAKGLGGIRRGTRLRLKALLRLLIGALSLRRRGETIRQRPEIAIVFKVVIALSRLSLLTALGERLRGLRGCNKSEVMFGVLQIILCSDRISPSVGVSGELEVFLSDMMRVAAYFDVRSIRFVGTRQRIGASPIVRRPAAHPFVLTWSHFNFPTSIRLSPALSDLFPAQAFSNLTREGAIHAFASFEWVDLIAPEVPDTNDRIEPVQVPFTSASRSPRSDSVLCPEGLFAGRPA